MKITVNGSEYASWDDVPEDIRRTLEANPIFRDTNHDGTPDGLEALTARARDGAAGSLPFTTTTTTTSVTIDGKTYDSLDQVRLVGRRRFRVGARRASTYVVYFPCRYILALVSRAWRP